jgi:HD-GYP domain-containing protein (c-di-GMP phosphodiesterase class II)
MDDARGIAAMTVVAKKAGGSGVFLPVPLTTLTVCSSLPVDMYVRPSEDAPPILYRERKLEFPQEEMNRLIERGVETIYVLDDQVEEYQNYLRDNLPNIVLDQNLPLQHRLQFLSEAGRSMLGEVFKSGSIERMVSTAGDISGHMVQVMSRHNLVAADLLDVLRHDYHTFTHSYNVASFAMLLARGLGISDPQELEAVSMGGLLHDLGKLRIPLAVLNKRSRLTDQEWERIKRHPHDGFVELSPRGDLSYEHLMMVYQHHEKLDGSGYPVGVEGDEIHPYARLCAVVDIFEALTSIRPYRSRMPVSKALSVLEQEADTKLDGEMVRCWKSLVNPVQARPQ